MSNENVIKGEAAQRRSKWVIQRAIEWAASQVKNPYDFTEFVAATKTSVGPTPSPSAIVALASDGNSVFTAYNGVNSLATPNDITTMIDDPVIYFTHPDNSFGAKVFSAFDPNFLIEIDSIGAIIAYDANNLSSPIQCGSMYDQPVFAFLIDPQKLLFIGSLQGMDYQLGVYQYSASSDFDFDVMMAMPSEYSSPFPVGITAETYGCACMNADKTIIYLGHAASNQIDEYPLLSNTDFTQWDTANKVSHVFTIPESTGFSSIQVSSDGKTLVATSANKNYWFQFKYT